MIHIDINYINKLSVRLNKFQRKGDYLYQFRCPYCGDSKKNPNKARGFFYRKEVDMIYKCHNCGIGRNVFNFLKDYDVELHKQYVVEKFKKNKKTQPVYSFIKPKFSKKIELKLDNLVPISTLPDDHQAKEYLVQRGITRYTDLHWTDNFYDYVDGLLPDKYPNLGTEGRIIIPFYTKESELTHLQGRSIEESVYNQRYVTVSIIGKGYPKIFGLNRINFNRKIYIVEGPFDSLFVPNSVALGGGDCDMLPTVVPNDKSVIVMDNEPRNRDTVKRMRKYISMDYTICIWPENLNEKDINEIFLSGLNSQKILDLINKNTFKGMGANLALSKWCKC